jgi:RimJ/RimL family protein N-acetyltransferase
VNGLLIVRAVVARENTRSLRLCARIGLTDERDDPDERFVQRLGRMARKSIAVSELL